MKPSHLLVAGLALLLSPALSSANAKPVELSDAQLDLVVAGTDFRIARLVANQPNVARVTDAKLVNPWGLAQAPAGPLWVANNGSGTSTVYNPTTGAKLPLTVTIPGTGGEDGAPTGALFNILLGKDTDDFVINSGGHHGQSVFLFATENGTIAGWSPAVSSTKAITVANRSAAGAVYKGLTQGAVGTNDLLFATNFASGKIDVFDSTFRYLKSFTDPNVPADFAPFNVQSLNGKLYVTFAKREQGGTDDVKGAGNGFVDVFETNGRLDKRLVSHGALDSPWGLAIAPASFGEFAGALLVGNFGDGKINAYDPTTGKFLGTLTDKADKPLTIDGLWALHAGPGGSLLFSAGPDDEANGLVGAVRPATAKARAMAVVMSGGTAYVTPARH